MKIIIHGDMTKAAKPLWPINHQFTCTACGCHFKIEQGDTFRQTTERCIGGNSYIDLPCPDCGLSLKFGRKSSTKDN